MNRKLRFVEIEEEHLPLVLEVYSYYVQNTCNTFHASAEVTLEELKTFIPFKHSRYKGYLFYEGEALAGYGYFSYYKKRAAYDRTAEVSVYLKQGYTGHGNGNEALQFLENRARQSGIKVMIATISAINEGSVRFFTRAGYEVCGRLKEVGDKMGIILDVLLMQKML